MVFRPGLLWNLTLFSLIHFFASATLVNITVDDNSVDSVSGSRIIYSQGWNYGPSCQSCEARPNPAETFMQSWHDTTFASSNPNLTTPQNATFKFTGKQVHCMRESGYSCDLLYRVRNICVWHLVPFACKPDQQRRHPVLYRQ